MISPIRRAAVVALGRRTAQWLAGILDVAAPIADGCKATRPENGEGPGRRVTYPLRCESSAWPPALAGHSGRCSVILASPLTRCGDWPRPIDPEWSEKLETALTAARRNDLKDGTNAAYVHGCVCEECREHQQIRMGRSRGQVR